MQGTDWRPPASPSDASMDSVGLDTSSNMNPSNPYSHYENHEYNSRSNNNNGGAQLRRRGGPRAQSSYGSSGGDKYSKKRGLLSPQSVKRLDFFEKVESDMTVKTDRGGRVTLIGYVIMVVLVLAEFLSWRSSNASLTEHVVVDTSLGKKMSVTLNITFPSLHCDDLHVDLMDVAGDAQNNMDTDSMVKKRLHTDGSLLTHAELKAEMNKAHEAEQSLMKKAKEHLSKDYCGPCYGAHEEEKQCCNTCESVIEAYKKKRWNYEQVRQSSEQCQREGKTKPKRMSSGEGCNLSGHMTFNRVSGNFHIAMGEGVERNGKHIHVFQPDDTINFNSSHIIHQLRFGTDLDTHLQQQQQINRKAGTDLNTLDGVQKIVTEDDGSTGMFQYFLKVVPTTYKGAKVVNMVYPNFKLNNNNKNDNNDDNVILETNRYFTTEVFKPLIEVDHTHYDIAKESNRPGLDDRMAGVHVGGKSGSSHDHKEHHKFNNAVLPGVFFMYQIYPFAIEVTNETVPFTHLLIRIMATIGGVMTIVGWIDGMLYAREKRQR